MEWSVKEICDYYIRVEISYFFGDFTKVEYETRIKNMNKYCQQHWGAKVDVIYDTYNKKEQA